MTKATECRNFVVAGHSGSGKTTLVSMIPRLYDCDEGQVLVDGVNVKDYSLFHLREGVGMVLQKNVLFSGTIEENLRWGDQDATEEEIQKEIEQLAADYNMEVAQVQNLLSADMLKHDIAIKKAVELITSTATVK